jgi:hypothetical protein
VPVIPVGTRYWTGCLGADELLLTWFYRCDTSLRTVEVKKMRVCHTSLALLMVLKLEPMLRVEN